MTQMEKHITTKEELIRKNARFSSFGFDPEYIAIVDKEMYLKIDSTRYRKVREDSDEMIGGITQ